MLLNDIGKTAHQFWEDIPTYTPFIELGAFAIMPNHMHGILIVNRDEKDDVSSKTLQCNVSTRPPIEFDPNKMGEFMSQISPKSGSISRILGSYKGAVTKQAQKVHSGFGWQERFHDHIIRNEKSFLRIENYILTNPENWENDKFYG